MMIIRLLEEAVLTQQRLLLRLLFMQMPVNLYRCRYGVYTADARKVPKARKLKEVNTMKCLTHDKGRCASQPFCGDGEEIWRAACGTFKFKQR